MHHEMNAEAQDNYMSSEASVEYQEQSGILNAKADHEICQNSTDEKDFQKRGELASQYLGPLSLKLRRKKVVNYLAKKINKINTKKHIYTCRREVSEKRLRIKGRFVTKEQAFQILGLTQDQLLDNLNIQTLLTQYAESPMMQVSSLIDNGQGPGNLIKVSNFQTLIVDINHLQCSQRSENKRKLPSQDASLKLDVDHISENRVQ